jgi:hypothetical protein
MREGELGMLGYGGNEDWRDMSEFLVHLTDTPKAFEAILKEETLRPGAKSVGAATDFHELEGTQRAVCLSEIPLDRLDRLVERHGEFGVGFRKTFIQQRSGRPVWYLHRDTVGCADFKELVRTAMLGGIDPADPVWRLTPFVDYPGVGTWGRYEFEWEREWRVVGDLLFNLLTDLEFIIAPQRTHAVIQNAWSGRADQVMPALLDLRWGLPDLQRVFAEHGLSGDKPGSSASAE